MQVLMEALVCNGQYETRHCTSSGSIESIYGKFEQVTLGCYDKSSVIFERCVIVRVMVIQWDVIGQLGFKVMFT